MSLAHVKTACICKTSKQDVEEEACWYQSQVSRLGYLYDARQ